VNIIRRSDRSYARQSNRFFNAKARRREGAKVCGKFADHHMDDHESSEAQAIDSGFLRAFAPSR
jgi:hypothetical protein